MKILTIIFISVITTACAVTIIFSNLDRYIVHGKGSSGYSHSRMILRKTIKTLIHENSKDYPRIRRQWTNSRLNELEEMLYLGQEYHNVPALHTLAFINHESSMDIFATGKNRDKKTKRIKSYDYGLAQINSVHVRDISDIYNIGTNMRYFFREYSRCMRRFGTFTDRAIVCYNLPRLAYRGSSHSVKHYKYNRYVRDSYARVKKIFTNLLDRSLSKNI